MTLWIVGLHINHIYFPNKHNLSLLIEFFFFFFIENTAFLTMTLTKSN